MNSFNIHWTSSRIFCVDFQETGLKYTFPATRFRYAHASSRLSASIRRCFRFYTMLGNLVETIKTRSRTRNAMFYVLYVLYISCWTKIYISKKEKKKFAQKVLFSPKKHRGKNNSILSRAILFLRYEWRNRWFVKDIDSIGQRHWSRRWLLPASVHCEIVCRYESLVIKRILLSLSELHPSLLREVHNCIFNADTRAPVCRRGRKWPKTRWQWGRERESSRIRNDVWQGRRGPTEI